MADDILEAGIAYMRAGLHILALNGKSPNGRYHRPNMTPAWGPFVNPDDPRWAKAAQHRSTSGVGIVIPAHLCVIDIDGEAGAVAFQALAGENVPWWGIARTGRGLHLWFVSPNIVRNGKLAEKLDVKGYGGYVVAPPSRHPDLGTRYEWLDPLISPDGTVRVDFLPDAIEQRLAEREGTAAMTLASTFRSGSIDGLTRHVASAGEGSRNSTLNWAAWQARQDGFPFAEIVGPLTEAAMTAGLPKDEAVRTVKSAYSSKGAR